MKLFAGLFLAAILTQNAFAKFEPIKPDDKTPATGPVITITKGTKEKPKEILATYKGEKVTFYFEYAGNNVTISAYKNWREEPVEYWKSLNDHGVSESITVGTIKPFSDKNMKLSFGYKYENGIAKSSTRVIYDKKVVTYSFLGLGPEQYTTEFKAEYDPDDGLKREAWINKVMHEQIDAVKKNDIHVNYSNGEVAEVQQTEVTWSALTTTTQDIYSSVDGTITRYVLVQGDDYIKPKKVSSLRISTVKNSVEERIFEAQRLDGERGFSIWYTGETHRWIANINIPLRDVDNIDKAKAAFSDPIENAKAYAKFDDGSLKPSTEEDIVKSIPEKGIKITSVMNGTEVDAIYQGVNAKIFITQSESDANVDVETVNNGYKNKYYFIAPTSYGVYDYHEISPFKDFPDVKVVMGLNLSNGASYLDVALASSYVGPVFVVQKKDGALEFVRGAAEYFKNGDMHIQRIIKYRRALKEVSAKYYDDQSGKVRYTEQVFNYSSGDVLSKVIWLYRDAEDENKITITETTEYMKEQIKITCDKHNNNERVIVIENYGRGTDRVNSFALFKTGTDGSNEEVFRAEWSGPHKYKTWYRQVYQGEESINLSKNGDIYMAYEVQIRFLEQIKKAKAYKPSVTVDQLTAVEGLMQEDVNNASEDIAKIKKAYNDLKNGISEYKNGLYGSAKELITKAINSDNLDAKAKPKAFYFLGSTKLALGDYAGAKDDLTKGLKNVSKVTTLYLSLYFKLGMAELGLENYKLASNDFYKVIEMGEGVSPSESYLLSMIASAHYLRGYTYAMEGKYKEANTEQESALETAKKSGLPLEKYIEGKKTMDALYDWVMNNSLKELAEDKYVIAELIYGGLLEDAINDPKYSAKATTIARDLMLVFSQNKEAMDKLKQIAADAKVQPEFNDAEITAAKEQLKAADVMKDLAEIKDIPNFIKMFSGDNVALYFEAMLKDAKDGTPDERALKYERLIGISTLLIYSTVQNWNKQSEDVKADLAAGALAEKQLHDAFAMDVLRLAGKVSYAAKEFEKNERTGTFSVYGAERDADKFIEDIKSRDAKSFK